MSVVVRCRGGRVPLIMRRSGWKLDYDHPIREVLDRETDIVGVRDAVVRVRDERNQMLMLDDRINELRHDPSYADSFPADPPKVAKTDMGKLTENFDKIASGEVRVE